VPHWWSAYWAWVGSNIGAMPAEFVITVVATLVFQKPIARLLALLRRDVHAAVDKAQEDAKAAREIVGDLYRHMTGEDHPVQNGK